ncbi:TBC1 domain family member 24-like [Callorhinchus milii]|uniref:TBC1 domain family member 24-like n=1 Tax=Callorhinchus milii TaxID=7868 RepID=UPI001C3FED9B|nr:TBC1 domain family member 24-like [Callorhinchus milii]
MLEQSGCTGVLDMHSPSKEEELDHLQSDSSEKPTDATPGEPHNFPEVPLLLITDDENWGESNVNDKGDGHFVDWDRILDPGTSPNTCRNVTLKSYKELKYMARHGEWAGNHKARATAYNHIIKKVHCRTVTPDAEVYRNIVGKIFGQSNATSQLLPDFVEGCNMPTYFLNAEGKIAVKKILICIADQFPDITYSPILPAIVALLLHYSTDEAECFENVFRLLACNDPKKRFIDQTFLTHESSCMTFGDLASKYCQASHKLIATQSRNAFEIYSDWLMWIFGDLPFKYAIRVLDVFLLEGYKALYRIGLALLKQYKLSLTSKEVEIHDVQLDLQLFMTNISQYTTVDQVLEKAFSIRLLSCKEIHLLQLANKKALAQKGTGMQQKRPNTYLAVDMLNFQSSIVTAQEMRIVWSWIPERFALFQPLLLFTTLEHGYSLQRFYSHCEGYEPTVLLFKTTKGEICGAFLTSDWNERRRENGRGTNFFGTGECFVFNLRPETNRYEWVIVKHPKITKAAHSSLCSRSPSVTSSRFSRSPPWSQSPGSPRRFSSPVLCSASDPTPEQNSNYLTVPTVMTTERLSPFLALRCFKRPSKTASMFMAGTNKSIIIGGGNGQALNIDADLHHGRTQRCDTFENPPLCSENFQIQFLEVWSLQN